MLQIIFDNPTTSILVLMLILVVQAFIITWLAGEITYYKRDTKNREENTAYLQDITKKLQGVKRNFKS